MVLPSGQWSVRIPSRLCLPRKASIITEEAGPPLYGEAACLLVRQQPSSGLPERAILGEVRVVPALTGSIAIRKEE